MLLCQVIIFRNFFVRGDKVLKLRTLIDETKKAQGFQHQEKGTLNPISLEIGHLYSSRGQRHKISGGNPKNLNLKNWELVPKGLLRYQRSLWSLNKFGVIKIAMLKILTNAIDYRSRRIFEFSVGTAIACKTTFTT